MARKSMKKNNSIKRSNSNGKQKRSKKQTSGAKKKSANNGSGGKLGTLNLNNLDNNKFWCMMCGKKDKKKGIVIGKDVKLVPTKNGRKALRGKCTACDCKVFRFC